GQDGEGGTGRDEGNRSERELQGPGDGRVRQHGQDRDASLRPLGVPERPGGGEARGRARQCQREGHFPVRSLEGEGTVETRQDGHRGKIAGDSGPDIIFHRTTARPYLFSSYVLENNS